MRIARVLAALLALAAAATPGGSAITPANVATLALRWELPLNRAVTGAPLLDGGVLYVSSWDGNLYALDPATGAQHWAHPVGGPIGVLGGPIRTPDGKICVGSSGADVVCVHPEDGSLAFRQTLGTPGLDAVWSALASDAERLYVSIASLGDNPCTRGRLVALDLATGAPQWTIQTVPDRICSTDTGVECTTDADCGGAPCVDARGAGVTATVTFDPTGEFLYMNTVGCYTFPSVGDSDSLFKVRAATGQVIWTERVTPPEQFGYCALDTSVECSTVDHCAGVGGTCKNPKDFYHDFGFLNGPLLLDVPGVGRLVVSGSKNGTLYAFHEADHSLAWSNPVQPVPVSPGFAGFGLFNGAIAHVDGRLYAALNRLTPARVCAVDERTSCRADGDCPSGACLPAPEHLMAFDAADGAMVWSDEIGSSWSSVAVANGVVYAGTNTELPETGGSELYAYDAAGGTRLATIPIPRPSAARAAVSEDTLFVAYGLFGDGGVRAYSLCGNGAADAGEACDPGDPAAAGCCSAACQLAPAGSVCDDGDACTGGDVCGGASCAGQISTAEQLGCVLARIDDRPCADGDLPPGLARGIGSVLRAVDRLVARAGVAASAGKTAKVARLRRAVVAKLDGIGRRAARAADSRRDRRRISAACRTAIDDAVARARTLVEGFTF